MTTKKIVSHAHVHAHSPSHSTSSAVEAAVVPTPAATPDAAAPSVSASSASAPAPLVYLTPPPPTALIPDVPSSFVPENGTNYRGVAPKKAELITLPLAVADLVKFTNYTAVLGTTAPPYDEIVPTFTVTNEWSTMRTASSAWDVYSQAQEGICWTVMRPAMDTLKAAFALAAGRDPSLLAKYPGLSALLDAKQAIAQKAASTKRLNKKAIAEGKPPIHGGVGKKRLKAANKAIVAAAGTSAGAAAPSQSASVASAPAPVAAPVVVTAPAVSVAPVAAVIGVSAVPASAANGVASTANGAGH